MRQILEDEIEYTRELMMVTASTRGLHACETIEISRKLDALMNQFEKQIEGCSDGSFIDNRSKKFT